MTKKLEELLNLPPSDEDRGNEYDRIIQENKEIITTVDRAIDKIDVALPSVKDLEASDDEMDELANLAKEHVDELMSLGLNMDPRFSGAVFQTASAMLGHAITAKTAKMDKKLKMIQLQLQKAKLDHDINKHNSKNKEPEPTEGEGSILDMDRTELLRQILEQTKTPNKDK